MNWDLSCRKARRSLALWAGNDLDEAGQAAMQRHLAVCPGCRQAWQDLQTWRQALEQARPAASERTTGAASIWPAVEWHIRAINDRPSPADWRDWLPAGALAAACVTLALILAPAGDPGSGARFAESSGAPTM